MERPRGTLCWKWEDGPEDVEHDHPDDIGPAWIERDGEPIEEVNGGDWITRAEAVRIAEAEGLKLVVDD